MLVAIAPVHLWMAIGAWSIPDLDNAAFLIFALLTGLLLPVFGIDLIRSDIERPYFFTLRFNRVRRKLYAYRQKGRFGLLRGKNWAASAEEYDRDNLRGRITRTKYGEIVELLAIDPLNNRIVETFQLERGRAVRGTAKWMLIRTFMQQGPAALSAFSNWAAPRNQPHPIFFMRGIIAQTQWPKQMDIASRTGNDAEVGLLNPSPVSDAVVQRYRAQLSQNRRVFFRRSALGLAGLLIACVTINHSPGLSRDTSMSLAWLQGAEPRAYDSPEALLADPPSRGWQVSLSGSGRCSVMPPNPDYATDALPQIDCNAIRWGSTGPKVSPLDIGNAWSELYDGDIFLAPPLSVRLRSELITQGKITQDGASAYALSAYDRLPNMPAYLDIPRMVQAVDTACRTMPKSKAASLASSRCASLQQKIIAILSDDGSAIGKDWFDLVSRTAQDPAFALPTADMEVLVAATVILADTGQAKTVAPGMIESAKQRLASYQSHPGFQHTSQSFQTIRREARILSQSVVNASALMAVQGAAKSQQGGVVVRVLKWRGSSPLPTPKAWPSTASWPPRLAPDEYTLWRELQILANEQGRFGVAGVVVFQPLRGDNGAPVQLVIDASHEITEQWIPALRLFLLMIAALALTLAIWWPPALQRRLCGDA